MFARTFSLCRRLLGKAALTAPTTNTAIQDERRLWVRYQADLQTQVRLAQADRSERVAVQVRNVSVGGAKLVADRPFQPGQILSLELPGDGDELQIVLACVVHVRALGPGQWSLGCAFSRELSGPDLKKFGTHQAPSSPADQRAWVRHDCALQATYQRIGAEDGRDYAAKVLNVSASGIGLLLQDPVTPGSLINLQLRNQQGALLRTILACVVHSTRRASQDGVVGCNFIRELSEDELHALL